MKTFHILHFAFVVNQDDFIDVIVRAADKESFRLSVCTLVADSNIKTSNFAEVGISHFVLHTSLDKKGFFPTIFKLLNLLVSQRVDVIHAHHYYESLIAAVVVWLTGRKLIITRHYHTELFLTTKGVKLWLYLVFERWVNRIADVVIAPSTQIEDLLMRSGVSERKIRMIPYGFNFRSSKYSSIDAKEIIRQRLKIGARDGEFLIGNVARHHPIKGQDLLIKAFARLLQKRPMARLVMVGDGPFHDELVQQVNDLGVADKVLFLGWQKDTRPLVCCMDVIIHPTNQEAFPQIMIETLALGQVLLITPVSGATDVIEDGRNGFIIPFRAPDAWAEILASINRTDKRVLQIVDKGRSDVRSRLAIELIIRRVEEVYRHVIANGR